MDTDVVLESGLVVPGWELRESFITSPGPGGQNVNKVATAVELRWSLPASSLPAQMKDRLARRLESRLTGEGEIIIRVSETRSQARNRAIARERLRDMLDAALKVRKRRVATRPTFGSVQRRLKGKAEHGQKKALRGKVGEGEG